MCARQLQRQNKDFKETTFHLQCICLEKKECYDDKHNICVKELTRGQIVLLHDTKRKKKHILKIVLQIVRTVQDLQYDEK